ncbi:GNAT family N-acetyltransferase [Pseudoduganella armeniaca]|uniref:GNAT family N-acetyltransferase n=1 Tax=Pseudoduganella armeniaca TaxID=2072590 RepID=A0A2R4CBN5_9BURK|nr:N-acetyltransferase [Pseudoduganella armeniaca]AVR97039.1 GNAT family N-acetyltransferase [Pseudoduganella armeniaca]
MSEPTLRTATPMDAPAMLALLRSVTTEGDTLPFHDDVGADFIDGQWLGAAGCVLACQGDSLLGMYRYGANMPGRGSHVATATFLVAHAARGCGLGRMLLAHCLDTARAAGFCAMQFNQVVATNHAALALYRSVGFRRVGRIPGAFAHPQQGYVAAYVMYLDLGCWRAATSRP